MNYIIIFRYVIALNTTYKAFNHFLTKIVLTSDRDMMA